MKINKSKSPFISGADAPDEKDIAKVLKGEKFSETLAALAADNSSPTGEMNATREMLAKIALQSDLSNDNETARALYESAEVLVKSRLGERFKQSGQSEKMIKDLSVFVADDPLMKAKLLSILKKLSGK